MQTLLFSAASKFAGDLKVSGCASDVFLSPRGIILIRMTTNNIAEYTVCPKIKKIKLVA